MTDKNFIFSETMRFVANEISNKRYDETTIEALFNKYLPVVEDIYANYQKKDAHLSMSRLKKLTGQ